MTAALPQRQTPTGPAAHALLNAYPDATAVLDRNGTITAVNTAWRMFALDNGGSAETTGVGVSYVDVCTRAAAAGSSDAADVLVALAAVQAGAMVESELEYPCPSPAVGRWFTLRVTPIGGDDPGLLISHLNISRRKLAELDLRRRASIDPLTGLANRSLFTERLTSALTPRPRRSTTPDVGVLFMDLDGFKHVNDTFGHAAGDEVLLIAAGRLTALTRPQDTIARLGGDEFAAVVTRIDAETLATIVARMEAALDEPHLIHGRRVSVGLSVGSHHAAAGEDAAHAMAQADEAMYVAKRARKSRAARAA